LANTEDRFLSCIWKDERNCDMHLPIKLLSFAAILFTAVAVKADTLNFTLSGGGDTFTFTLPSNPTPDTVVAGSSFTLLNTLINDEGAGFSFSSDLTFTSLSQGGGLMFDLPGPPATSAIDLTGPQIYTGSESSPIFSATSTPFVLSTPKGGGDFTLSIDAASTVPEPSCIVFVTTGLIALAAGARRKFAVR
jgi:hypothetical protein